MQMYRVGKSIITASLSLLATAFLCAKVDAADQNLQSVHAVEQQPRPATTMPATQQTGEPAQQTTTPAQQSKTTPGSPALKPPIAPATQSINPNLKTIQIEEDYWIDPDRPHIADSSVNVPKGLWLQENGFQQSFADHTGAFDFPETLIRLGIASRLELRYNTPNFFTGEAVTLNPSRAAVTQKQTGFQNMQSGFKYRLGPLAPTKFQIAVNPYVAIPTGFSNESRRVDGFIKFPFSQAINERWDIEGMESLFDPTGVDGRRNFDWQNSLVLNRSWGRQRNVFVEYVGDLFQYGHMSNLVHFGAAYRPNRRNQVDLQFGFRISHPAPIAFFGFGYSFLLGSLETPKLTPSHFPPK